MLNVDALSDYTQGRLDVDAGETALILARSLAVVRRWCGWHVSPVVSSEITLDGQGGRLLRLPTLRLVELTSIAEDGVDIDPADLQISQNGMLRKTSGALWTTAFGGIAVTMSHGFSDAADFEAAVLSVAERASRSVGGVPVSVGPFRWADEQASNGTPFTLTEMAILEQYRLDPSA